MKNSLEYRSSGKQADVLSPSNVALRPKRKIKAVSDDVFTLIVNTELPAEKKGLFPDSLEIKKVRTCSSPGLKSVPWGDVGIDCRLGFFHLSRTFL